MGILEDIESTYLNKVDPFVQKLMDEYTTAEGWKGKLVEIGNNAERTARIVGDIGNPNQSPDERQEAIDHITGFGGGGIGLMTRPEIYRAIGKIPGWRERIVNDPALAQSIKNALRGSKQTDLDRVKNIGVYADRSTDQYLLNEAANNKVKLWVAGNKDTRGIMRSTQSHSSRQPNMKYDSRNAGEPDSLEHEIYMRMAQELTPEQMYKLFGHEIGHVRVYGHDVSTRDKIRNAIDNFMGTDGSNQWSTDLLHRNRRRLESITDTSMHEPDEVLAEAFGRGHFAPSLAEDDMFFSATNTIDPDLTRYLWKYLQE